MTHPFIETYSGAKFYSTNPSYLDIHIEDIAHALSNQCRFAGHTRVFYSVAEHCVRVSELIAETCVTDTRVHDSLWGLLHDAAEAYLLDLPTPIKNTKALGAPFRAAESDIMREVCKRFHLSLEPKCVKWADGVLLATEVRDLMHPGRPYWKDLLKHEPLNDHIRPWSSMVAEQEFLDRFRMLGGAEHE